MPKIKEKDNCVNTTMLKAKKKPMQQKSIKNKSKEKHTAIKTKLEN